MVSGREEELRRKRWKKVENNWRRKFAKGKYLLGGGKKRRKKERSEIFCQQRIREIFK